MYDATVAVFAKSMLKTVREALLPIVYVAIDLWTNKAFGDKLIGACCFGFQPTAYTACSACKD